MKKPLFTLLIILGFSVASLAQDKPIRIGIKFGVPQVIGLNAEYVTPLLGKKLAASADFSYFSLSIAEASASYSYFELGANYYFMNEGKGLYGNVSYGRMGFNFEYEDYASDIDPSLSNGSGEANVGINLVNLKLGAKLGGLFYFRPELGYAVATGDSNYSVRITYPDGTTESVSEELPGALAGGFVVNLGFGFAF